MCAKKSGASGKSAARAESTSWIAYWTASGPRRTFSILVLSVTALSIGAAVLWNQVRDRVLAQAEYRLDLDDVEVTPPPAWVRTDVRSQVLTGIGWDPPPSVLEPDLVDQFAQAFSLHPWVRKVTRVTKHHPARVAVELEYRRPVLMVEVPGGWLPVDAEGVVLPAADFAPRETEAYPRFVGIKSAPLGPEGTHWGDPVVSEAALVGEVLAADWTALGLAALRPVDVPVGVPHNTELHGSFELWTLGQTRIIWGHAPGQELAGEPSGREKVARLKAFALQQGSLDTQGSRWDLDLRPPAGLQIAPKTVRLPAELLQR